MKLKQGAMTCVGVCQQHGFRQVLAQHVGVSHRDHLVQDPVHDETGLTYFAELPEALAIDMLPGAKCRDLSSRDLWPRDRLMVLIPLCKPRHESLAGRLTRFAWGEEQFHQFLQSWEVRILKDL